MMFSTRASRAFTISAATTVVGLSIAALTGCSSGSSTPTPAPTVTVTVTPTATPTATSSPTSSPTSAAATPVDIACNQLVFDSIVTDFSPGLTLDSSYTPTSGSTFQTMAGLDGTVCHWADTDGGSATLTVGVAKPSASALAAQEATLSSAGYGTSELPGSPANRGYEARTASTPELDMFTESGYWIAVASPGFTKDSDSNTFFQNVLQTLPSG
ncbi:hypothetical protein [Subtercola endophyticus]|uniref:hypothetical protein n=1 Tax=Subtercola endophyticus TaxID=2895559 RepID=UPI001E3AC31A|nr:hypothetical protein [Subtercola endophyticus]UFS59840.1 hypothetical protein LQ955_03325 [Subtercola endophyticus]